MTAVLRPMAAAALCVLALSGCALAPVPPPSQAGATQVQAAAPAATAAPAAPAQTAASGFSVYERSALRVRNIGCGGVAVGSGFAIADHVFVTNRHVVGGAAQLQVSTYDGQDITVNAVSAVVVADLALVWTKEPLPATLEPAASNPAPGTEVTAVGYPLGGQLTTTTGRVTGYGPDPVGWSSVPMLYNDAPIEHGSSGSPLVDSAGRLVGVAYATAGTGQYVAVPVETLTQVLQDPSKFTNGAGCDGVLPGQH